jgi:hypothetical protein
LVVTANLLSFIIVLFQQYSVIENHYNTIAAFIHIIHSYLSISLFDSYTNPSKFNRSRPKIVQDTTDCAIENNGKFCGVILNDGSICTKSPVEKRVRCLEHKGMRINAITAKAIRRSKSESETVVESITKTIICGVIMENGSTCRREPVKGRKRCHEHKGKRIRASVPINQK